MIPTANESLMTRLQNMLTQHKRNSALKTVFLQKTGFDIKMCIFVINKDRDLNQALK